ncbi:MAG: DUF1190 domain-containing protein [Thermosynechococcaceae cyanobacterium MS004]|nr:DUF1190 domain-containing protein [Thermosynechococcaceae cyanobacterium MS004]
MTHRKREITVLEVRLIQRQRVQQSLAIAAVAALILSSCDSPTVEQTENTPVDAVFYETAQQCEADIKRQTQAYQTQLAAQKRGELKQTPTPPVMKPEDCAPQILAARQEHEKTAPFYANQQDCQAEGVQCEPVRNFAVDNSAAGYSSSSGYRPVYGGTYFYPYVSPSYSYVNYGGSYRRVYAPRPVYASKTPGQVVTPYGRTVAKTTTGRVSVPQHTTVQAPSRPSGTSARGTISGRSKFGFGSTFKSTGRGGK